VGVHDPNGIERLSQPIGYWNGLAIFAAMGALLALGFAARARSVAVRAVCAASLVLFLPTVYFTFGRGAWVALAAGLLVMIAAGPQRLQLLAVLAATAPATAAAVALASREPALTHAGSNLALAAHEGHRLALVFVALAAVNAAAAFAVAIAEPRVEVGPIARMAAAGAAILVAVAACVAVFARFGSPVQLAHRAYEAFRKPPPAQTADLNARLLNFSGNGRAQAWRLAWDDARHHLLAGDGAGSYERYFLAHEPANVSRVRDAHSLYVETLSELGIVGLLLVLGMVALPFVALRRARALRVAPAVVGAYAAYIVHTGIDWDWELPAVTLVGLLSGATLLLAARHDDEARPLGTPLRIGVGVAAVCAAVFAGLTLVGNTALARSASSLSHGDPARAASSARRAHSFLPWSPAPWDALGRAELRQGRQQEAQASFRKAISIDRGDWQLWYDLARATSGRAHAQALAMVDDLYPRSGLVAGGKG
jgi:tetratricopeptide (TPR) repeat protein